eukprot:3665891-Ditylum_brightwellii.AAC.1
MGVAHMRSLYLDLYLGADTDLILPTDPFYYYHVTIVSLESVICLQWWKTCLQQNSGITYKPENTQILAGTWGNGSGTGVGGSLLLYCKFLGLWCKEECVCVWSSKSQLFHSKWKGLYTLAQMLERERRHAAWKVVTCYISPTTWSHIIYFNKGHQSSKPLPGCRNEECFRGCSPPRSTPY